MPQTWATLRGASQDPATRRAQNSHTGEGGGIGSRMSCFAPLRDPQIHLGPNSTCLDCFFQFPVCGSWRSQVKRANGTPRMLQVCCGIHGQGGRDLRDSDRRRSLGNCGESFPSCDFKGRSCAWQVGHSRAQHHHPLTRQRGDELHPDAGVKLAPCARQNRWRQQDGLTCAILQEQCDACPWPLPQRF